MDIGFEDEYPQLKELYKTSTPAPKAAIRMFRHFCILNQEERQKIVVTTHKLEANLKPLL